LGAQVIYGEEGLIAKFLEDIKLSEQVDQFEPKCPDDDVSLYNFLLCTAVRSPSTAQQINTLLFFRIAVLQIIKY
jgi:hypothetical protein